VATRGLTKNLARSLILKRSHRQEGFFRDHQFRFGGKTMKRITLALALAALPASSFAATIAVIDSGTDYQHRDLAGQYFVNEFEVPGNEVDEDNNGLKDDVYGWNFAESNASVIDYKYLDRLRPTMPEIKKLFEIQVRTIDGTATEEEKNWIKSKKDDQKFLKELQIFGNFAHGTHVAGISAGHSTSVKKDNHPFGIKLIPTEVKLPFSQAYATSPAFQTALRTAKIGIPTGLKEMLLEFGLRFIASQQSKVFAPISEYVNARGAHVANGSFGTGYTQAKMIVGTMYNLIFKEEERSNEKLEEFTQGFMQQVLIAARALVTSAPNTLFVFAAGNDGVDNTPFPASPANLKEDNTITVAATTRNRELAPFSNYGTKVEVAAPGVGIASLYPGDDHGLMSGTSQAAPYVAMVAAEIHNQNPDLRPIDIKNILMGTVDTKDWLIGKVTSSGVVNPDRASLAASLSKTMAVHEAVDQSRKEVADKEVEEAPVPPTSGPGPIHTLMSASDHLVLPLPSPIQ
jgi:subtilisin family serine protease